MSTQSEAAQILTSPDKLFIDGEWVAPAGTARFGLVSPSTEQVFMHVAAAQVDDIDRAVAAARRAFDHGPWPHLSPRERATFLRALGREIVARTQGMSALLTAEMGGLYAANLLSVPRFAGPFDFYADMADTFPFIESVAPAVGGAGYLIREPVGVVGAIVPWNGPLMISAWKIAPALLAGCTVVLKASPEAPTTLLALAEAAQAVGLPEGVLNVVTADRTVSEHLVTHPGVDKISFTGSTVAGKRIASLCGERVARCNLELGGKSPAVILDDYDLEAFADTIAASSIILSGQICASLTRVIVTRSRQAGLLEAIKTRLEKVRVGDPFDPQTQMGPLAMARQRDRVEAYIAKGRSEGATLVTGGRRPSHLDLGFYVEPTLFGDVDNSTTIAREEIFGPVLSVIPADDEEQAIAIANDTCFGLNASVFTRDTERAFAVARRIRSGTVAHNAFKIDFSIGFGGFKQSGIGREGGIEGLRAFLENKTVLLDRALNGVVA
ncbi:MAG: Aldehyde dehydrogenase [Bradyrhizobium sp.]|nr:Aldehyde dehydrogenase [Bradyrhizobium sp.]